MRGMSSGEDVPLFLSKKGTILTAATIGKS